MNVAIIGPGAIGGLFAAHIAAHGFSVVLGDHDTIRASLLSSSPMKVWSDDGYLETRIKCVAQARELAKVDYLVFCVKAYSTKEAALQWRDAVGPETFVVSLQNGLGNLEVLQQHFGKDKVILAVTEEGSTFLAPGQIYHAARGITKVAPLSLQSFVHASNFVQVLARAGFNSVVGKDAHWLLWEKLIINASINPVSVLTNLTNGQLLNYPSLRNLLSEIATETYNVARTIGIAPELADPSASVLAAAASTSKNKSSMLQDIERKRRTEIDFINGKIHSLARSREIEAPLNGTMYAIVKTLEEKATGRIIEVPVPEL